MRLGSPSVKLVSSPPLSSSYGEGKKFIFLKRRPGFLQDLAHTTRQSRPLALLSRPVGGGRSTAQQTLLALIDVGRTRPFVCCVPSGNGKQSRSCCLQQEENGQDQYCEREREPGDYDGHARLSFT